MTVDADVTGFEPVSVGTRKVGFVTSGAYGHHVKQSLALAYVERSIAEAPAPVDRARGRRAAHRARILAEPPYDPKGLKLRELNEEQYACEPAVAPLHPPLVL